MYEKHTYEKLEFVLLNVDEQLKVLRKIRFLSYVVYNVYTT